MFLVHHEYLFPVHGLERKEAETSLIQDVFRALLIAQPFLWIWIIEDERGLKIIDDVNAPYWFSVLVFVWSVLILIFDVNIGFYTSELLILYALMVFVSTWVLVLNHSFIFRKAIATSFLIVYLNSWYWESFLHIWAILENGFNLNQFFQALHLLPAVYFLMRYKFDTPNAVDQVSKGFLVSTIIGFSRSLRIWKYLPMIHTEQTVYFINHGLMIMNRLICWVFLFNAIIIWGMHRSDYRKLMRQTKVLYT